jgi:hypothetical protein
LSGLTPWGLRYDAALGIRNNTGTFNRFDEVFTSNASIGLVQPLLRGFGTATNLAPLRIARNNVLVSEWELRKRIIDTVTTTNFVYNELHLCTRKSHRRRALARPRQTTARGQYAARGNRSNVAASILPPRVPKQPRARKT